MVKMGVGELTSTVSATFRFSLFTALDSQKNVAGFSSKRYCLYQTDSGEGDDMMAAMRTQSTYMMPMMTLFIGLNFSIGI